MKIPCMHVRSACNYRSLKSVSAIALTVIGLFCGTSSALAVPILGSASLNSSVLSKSGIPKDVAKSKIRGSFGFVPKILVDEADFIFVESIEKEKIVVANSPIAQQTDLDVSTGAPFANIGSLAAPILEVTKFESNGGFDKAVNIQSVAVVPEPAILALFGLGLAGFGFARRLRR